MNAEILFATSLGPLYKYLLQQPIFRGNFSCPDICMYFSFQVVTAGLGWAGAEWVLSRFLMLWVGARGAEFDWKYIQSSLESNISLVSHLHF